MEKFIYIGNVTSSLSLLYPAESWRGAHPVSDTELNIYFTPIEEGGLYPDKDNDVITITTTDISKHKDVLEALVEEINIGKIDHRLKLKQDEVGLTQKEIWEKKYK